MDAVYIAFIAVSALAMAIPIFCGVAIMVMRKKSSYRYPLGGCLIVFGFAVFFLNPFSNVMASFWIDDRHSENLERNCLGKNAEAIEQYWKKPDTVFTNEFGTYLWYRNTSPWWSMWKQDTVVLMSNGVAVRIWLDD